MWPQILVVSFEGINQTLKGTNDCLDGSVKNSEVENPSTWHQVHYITSRCHVCLRSLFRRYRAPLVVVPLQYGAMDSNQSRQHTITRAKSMNQQQAPPGLLT